MKNIIQPTDLSSDFFKLDGLTEKVKIKQLYTLAQLRAETTNPPLIYLNDVIKGFFLLDKLDLISIDDNLNIIVTLDLKRYKRLILGSVTNSSTFISKEKPIGLINGSNNIFTITYTPILNTEHVYVNGSLMQIGDDYTINNNVISFNFNMNFVEKLVVTYYK